MPKKELSKELLEVLACPKCHSNLNYNRAKNFLKCQSKKCALTFKVEDGIPIMLLKE
ncbi:MAG TPA: Trm112 family protein [Candidatus Diapherotrites archaeon]|uniref:Trm112 family protein n=1 Tax=Candidatus Iainarchaeum sp. TaxID=3101447 RepID=A0A7J4JW82_9ARCH|nr:Trm112 family protein [Candidatus Diapherotrites archaeon]